MVSSDAIDCEPVVGDSGADIESIESSGNSTERNKINWKVMQEMKSDLCDDNAIAIPLSASYWAILEN